jgi:hypothetical protein
MLKAGIKIKQQAFLYELKTVFKEYIVTIFNIDE